MGEVMESKKLIILAFGLLLAIAAVAGAAVGYDIYRDRQAKVVIKGPVDLYESYEDTPLKKVASLTAADQAKVLRIRYGKDFQAVKIATSDGREGWLISGGNFEVK